VHDIESLKHFMYIQAQGVRGIYGTDTALRLSETIGISSQEPGSESIDRSPVTLLNLL
jgi:hypothetical protein